MIHLFNRLLTFFLPLLFVNIASGGSDTISLIFAGDVMQHKTQIDGVYKDGIYDYEPCFRLIKEEISSADLAFANMEFPLGGKPYSGHPLFSAPDDVAMALKNTGFDVLLTANNHSCDRGKHGMERTLNILDSFDISHTGMFRNAEEREKRYPMTVSVQNFKIAVLNYTYGTNGIPVAKPLIINLIDSSQIITDITVAKQSNPDIIIAYMHWGLEYKMYPNNEQKRLTELLFRHGVNIIIGAHPHVIQPMEKRYSGNGRCDKLVAYSLGNLVSNQPARSASWAFDNTEGGAILKVVLIKDSISTRISWAGYNLVWVYKPKEDGRTRHYILPAADYENNTEMLNTTFQTQIKTFTNNIRKLLNKENTGIGEYRILQRQSEPIHKIEPIMFPILSLFQ